MGAVGAEVSSLGCRFLAWRSQAIAHPLGDHPDGFGQGGVVRSAPTCPEMSRAASGRVDQVINLIIQG